MLKINRLSKTQNQKQIKNMEKVKLSKIKKSNKTSKTKIKNMEFVLKIRLFSEKKKKKCYKK